MIGKLLGHTQVQTTARYAHLARHSVKVAATRIADSLEADMDTPPAFLPPPDLRHSFASRALALGESLSMIGKLLGHRKVQTTARYAHLAQDSVKASAARVAESLRADMVRGGSSVGTT